MTPETLALLAALIFLVALLYSSVGHAGASGYIAVMSLLSLAPEVLKPTALSLNILVATIATWQFARAGHFSWRLFWPFALLAVPAAFLGGYLTLPADAFKMLLGAVLLFSAARFLFEARTDREPHLPSVAGAITAGSGIGLLAGLTGTGGGIFLTPLMLVMGWARPKTAAAVSAPFILVNSAAGLAGNIVVTGQLPTTVWPLLGAALVGGFLGSHAGSQRLPGFAIKRLLAVVLTIAGLKLLLT